METKNISITDIDGILVGHAQDRDAATGVTVILCEKGAVAGCNIRGGGPASRETPLLYPESACSEIHAVTISGGSAYGLDACGGVMEYLEAMGVGIGVAQYRVPLVVGASVFDLIVGDGMVRPDKAMGMEACKNASSAPVAEGNVGVGTGCSVGKFTTLDRAMKSGVGVYGVQMGALKVAALVAVNALGNVRSEETGEFLAGMLDEQKKKICDAERFFLEGACAVSAGANTTIACVATNGKLTKAEANKTASMSHNGFARTIRPVHTSMDGDTVFVLSTGEVDTSPDVVGTIAADCVAKAIMRACRVEGAYGLSGMLDPLGENVK